ncbi:MAG: PAS domain S-box protein [Deltaproteobacteria bacterium]|nr:PAS domain S-box protein [Deltaproteobacteria bacterium]
MAADRNLTAESGGSSHRGNRYARQVKKLSMKYNRVLLFSALAFIALVLGLAALQYLGERSRELQDVNTRMSNCSAYVEELLRGVSNQMGRMSLWAEDHIGMLGHQHRNNQLRGLLQYSDTGDNYHLDRLEPPYNRSNTGNIVGLGSLTNRSDAFFAEMDMALALFRMQSIVHSALPYVERTYYVSNEKFVASFPWMFSPDSMKLSGSTMREAFNNLYREQFWQSALPGNNVDRQSYWTEAYLDPGQDKLIVTNCFPLYEDDRFLGVLAADLTVGFLNGVVEHLNLGGGQLILVDRKGQVLGDSGWMDASSREAQTLRQVVPKAIANEADEVMRNTNRSSYISGYNVIVKQLDIAPWSLVHILQESAITSRLLPRLSVYLGLTLGLAVFLVFAQIVIRRQFVSPAISMAEFIQTQAIEGKAAIPQVPGPWLEGFEAISETFKLKQVEKHLRSFMESASGFVVYQLALEEKTPNKSQLMFVSPSIKDVMGIPEPYKFETWFENVHPEERGKVMQAALESIARAGTFEHTMRIYHGGKNDWVWIHARATPVFDHEGKLMYFNGLIVDITDRKKAEADLERELAKFQALYDLATAMTADRNLDQNLSQIVEKSRQLLQVDISYIGLLDNSNSDIYVRTWSGLRTEALKTRRIHSGAGLAGKVIQTSRPYLVRDYYEEVESTFHDIARREGIVSGIAAPIIMGKETLGVFFVYNRSITLFSESDVTSLSLLGNLAAVEISRNRMEKELERASEELETRVEERTEELILANEKLNQEIWERKAVEQALAVSEHTLRVIFNNSRDPIFIHSVDGKIVDVNNRMLETYQVSREQALTFSIEHDYSSDDNPVDQLPGIWTKVQQGENQFFEWKARRPNDGSVFDVEMFLCKVYTGMGDLILANIHDVTERKRDEAELKFQKAYAEQLVDNSPDAIAVIDLEDKVARINPAFTKLFGYTDEDALGHSLNHLVAPPDRVDEAEAMSLAARRGNRIDVDTVRKRKDGSLIDVSLGGSLIIVDGAQVGFFGIYRDNTDRTRALLALQQSEELYRALVESIPYGISEMDVKGIITFANSTQSRITGYSRQELIGMPSLQLLADDSERKEFIRFGPSLLTNNPPPETWFGKIRTRDERLLDVQVDWNYKRDEKGNVIGFITILTDVTERKRAEEAIKESEEKYRLVVEHASEGIVILQDWQVKYANPRLKTITGYSTEEIASMPLRDIIHPDDFDLANKFRRQILDSEPVLGGHVAFRLFCHDGTVMWTQVSGVLIRWEGKPGVLCFVTDITEARKMQEDLVKIEKLDSIGVLAGGIAHDFNNLLTAILGNVSLARLGLHAGDRRSERLGEAEKACYRARDLTQQLLAFAKGGAPIKQTVSLKGVIRDTIEFAVRGSQCTGDVFSDPDTWPVDVDPGQLGQVFTNLCINACQAMPQGGRISVRIENVVVTQGDPIALEEGRYVRVSVQDHGEGIAAEHQPKIFDPYFTTKPKGSGLGLATSYAIVKNHRGLITLESKLGEGSTFYIYLPASEAEIRKETDLEQPAEQASRGKVLLMDDEESIRSLVVDLLSMIGYEVEASRDGAECVQIYERSLKSDKPFDVVILDLTIPGGMGGEAAVKALLKIDPHVKAVVSSGYADAPIMAECRDYGFCDVIPKPYDVAELCRILERVMSQPSCL